MSVIARWSYKATATVKPYLGRDGTTNQITYGEPYEILCNYTAAAEQRRDEKGQEFVSRYMIYTEDARPKYLDHITLDHPDAEPQEIRSRTIWDMALFNDVPDYLLVT